ncbi:hypothetical protein BDB01DRAFT_113076 [Pilobolus umbonatus]|nr:hypothetical protein BDB01DRAFT_113076 [Pilobolus umbonatus]
MVLLLLKSKWGYLFTNEEEVVSIVKDVLPYVAVFVFSDNIAGVADGVLNGMGRQHVGAWCNLVAYYFSALPLGFWLCFSRGWKLKGIWMALLLSLVVAALITILVVLTSNWNKEARKAEDRAKKEEDFIN